jgi:hypothetical protein
MEPRETASTSHSDCALALVRVLWAAGTFLLPILVYAAGLAD